MEQQFNFQINPGSAYWDNVKVHTRIIPSREEAVKLARRTAAFYRSEVRLTEGAYPFTTSGSYFNHKEY